MKQDLADKGVEKTALDGENHSVDCTTQVFPVALSVLFFLN